MKKIFTTALLLCLSLFLLPATAICANDLASYTYSLEAGDSLVLKLGNHNLRIDYNEPGGGYSLIFRNDTAPPALYLLEKGRAIRLTQPGLERVAADLNTKYSRMRRQLTETLKGTSKKQKQEMKENLPNLDPINLDSGPVVKIIKEREVEWRGFKAQQGYFKVNGETRARALVLDQSPVKLNKFQKATLNSFQRILNSWIEIIRRQAVNNSVSNPYTETQNLIVDYFPRLAKLEANQTVVLESWDLGTDGKRSFTLPDSITVQTLEDALFN